MNMTEKPLVSIIIPVYNVEIYIDTCLDSVTQQTYKNLEIIVVEDCSTDNSKQALQPYLKDNRIKLIQHSENGGLSAARNTGMESATGEYMMFVDSDDIIDLNLVEACLQGALESVADVVLLTVKPFQDGEPVQVIPELKNRLNGYKSIAQTDYFKYPHFAWLKFMRTELVRSKGLQFPVGQYYEDWPFHWEIGSVASEIVVVSDGYYHYRQRGDSITGSGDQKLLHIFSSHRLVVKIAEQYSLSLQAKTVLANKIYRGIWFVLTTIDSQYLEEGVIKAKEHIEVMSKYDNYSSPSLKVRLLLLSLKLPVNIAMPAVISLRKAINQLSSARRQAR
ncbi:glycosyltransferase family 2 protein [Psychrobacter sp. S4(2024)]|uniref:glycosyltransferase family 2 protein n=1 Tax=Psychrobacter sp. S4(2024) TaxID=3111913 RepID=UPI002FE20C7E